MSIWAWLVGLFAARTIAQAPPANPPPAEELTPKPLRISAAALDALKAGPTPRRSPFVGLPTPPPGVRPRAEPVARGMAMDAAGMAEDNATPGGAWGAWATSGMWGEGLFFPGYPYLAELAQRPEYRHIVETMAEEMTRKWIKLVSTGDDDKTDQIKVIEAAMKRLQVREAFNRMAELDGFMGMGVLYIDIDGASDDPAELQTPLLIDKAKIGKGALLGFVPVDPTWISPLFYNSTDPLKPDFFVPSMWYVMGKRVHSSRLLILRSREVPDILKSAYNFGGMSMSQMAKPYVDNWLRTRQSVSDLLHSFSIPWLKTNMMEYLQDASALIGRLSAFIMGRDNKGLFMLDKEGEEFGIAAAPLGTLDKLQAQAQEQLASVSQIPVVKLLGISPTGLNVTPDGEIRVFYDRIKAKQEKGFGALITTALELIQLSEAGSIDDEIGYEFLPLWELDDAGKAAVEKTKADTDAVYMQEAVISNEEVRTRLAGDPASPYHGLEGPAPEMTAAMEAQTNHEEDMAGKIDKEGSEGSETGANSGV